MSRFHTVVVLADGTSLGLAAGLADTLLGLPMTPAGRLLQGSVGKTYVAAVAMQLVHEGKLDLDAKVSHYLADEPWFLRLPNGGAVTVRQHRQIAVAVQVSSSDFQSLKAAPVGAGMQCAHPYIPCRYAQ